MPGALFLKLNVIGALAVAVTDVFIATVPVAVVVQPVKAVPLMPV